jgi:hypothetical protein
MISINESYLKRFQSVFRAFSKRFQSAFAGIMIGSKEFGNQIPSKPAGTSPPEFDKSNSYKKRSGLPCN